MNKAERQQLLHEKIRGNHQRNSRQKYLSTLPGELSGYLAQRRFLVTPEADAITPLFLIHPLGLGPQRLRPPDYTFREFSWPDQLLEAAGKIKADCDEYLAYFFPSGANPIYEVTFRWFRENLNALFPYSPEEIGAVAQDGSFGLVISNYCGYLPHDPNPGEVVYELATWGFGNGYSWRLIVRAAAFVYNSTRSIRV